MKDKNTNDNNINKNIEFENLIEYISALYELEILYKADSYCDNRYDYKIKNSKNITAIVELKLFSSLIISSSSWRATINQMENSRKKLNYDRMLLITNSQLPITLKFEKPEYMDCWDYDTISFLIAGNSEMIQKWEKISQLSFIHRSEPIPIAEVHEIGFVELSADSMRTPLRKPVEFRGAQICRQMKSVKPGNGRSAIDFENICVEALKYIFDPDLINWSPQRNSHGRLHRYDLIARISSQNDFWNSLVSDHRARYVIFEFKNYRAQITQSEIYSTEKYLYPQAMRSTGIIVSQKGASKNALRAMHGAFRESGKLILSLDTDQMCRMISMRENGDDPVDVLAELIEDMLMGLER